MEVKVHHFVLLIVFFFHPELVSTQSYTAYVSELKANNCSFPDPFFYDSKLIPQGMSPALNSCRVLLPDTPLTDPLSSSLQSAHDVCLKFFSFAQAMCQKDYKPTADKFLTKDALLSRPQYDTNKTACWYARGLPETLHSYMPPFMLNQTACSHVCSPGLTPEPVCRLLVSTLCLLNEDAPGCVPATTSGEPDSTSGKPADGKVSNGTSGAAPADVAPAATEKPGTITAKPEVNKNITAKDHMAEKNVSSPARSGQANITSVSEGKTQKPQLKNMSQNAVETPASTVKPAGLAVTTKTAVKSPEITTKGAEIKTDAPRIAISNNGKEEAGKDSGSLSETKLNQSVPVPALLPGLGKATEKPVVPLSTKQSPPNTADNAPTKTENNTSLSRTETEPQTEIKGKTVPPMARVSETVPKVSKGVTTVPPATTTQQIAQTDNDKGTTIKGGDRIVPEVFSSVATSTEEEDIYRGDFDLDDPTNRNRGGSVSSDRSRLIPSRNGYDQNVMGQNHRVHQLPTGQDSPGSGHFFAYFLTAVVICISGYVIFHNKQRIVAFIIEGRNGGRGTRRRSASGPKYSQLKSSVEEVMPSLESATTAKNFVY